MTLNCLESKHTINLKLQINLHYPEDITGHTSRFLKIFVKRENHTSSKFHELQLLRTFIIRHTFYNALFSLYQAINDIVLFSQILVTSWKITQFCDK